MGRRHRDVADQSPSFTLFTKIYLAFLAGVRRPFGTGTPFFHVRKAWRMDIVAVQLAAPTEPLDQAAPEPFGCCERVDVDHAVPGGTPTPSQVGAAGCFSPQA
jgi:hypothetical protein